MSVTNPDDGRNRRKAIFDVEDDDLEIKSEDESDIEEELCDNEEEAALSDIKSEDEDEENLNDSDDDVESDSEKKTHKSPKKINQNSFTNAKHSVKLKLQSDSEGEESEDNSLSGSSIEAKDKMFKSTKLPQSGSGKTRLSTKGSKRKVEENDDINEDINSDVSEHLESSIKKKKVPVEAETVR